MSSEIADVAPMATSTPAAAVVAAPAATAAPASASATVTLTPAELEAKFPIFDLSPEKPNRPTDYLLLAVNKPPADAVAPLDVHGRKQTSPPEIPVSYFYPDGKFPVGQIQEYTMDSNTYRTTSAEKREAEKPNEEMYNNAREAAEAHRIARQDIMKYIRPGVSLFDIATQLETSTARLIGKNHSVHGTKRGWAFPTGLSVNHIAAHFSPNAGDKTILGENDVLKVDFGTHVNGRIIDCAFTVHFNHEYDGLVEAVKEATETGVRVAGIDMRLGDIGGVIQEVRICHSLSMKFVFRSLYFHKASS